MITERKLERILTDDLVWTNLNVRKNEEFKYFKYHIINHNYWNLNHHHDDRRDARSIFV